MRVLVVEENLLLQRTLLRTLQNEGFETHGESSISETCILSKPSYYELLLLDESRNITHALEEVRKVRSGGFSGPVFLLVSNVDHLIRPTDLSDAGVTEVLVKPLSLGSLRECLDRILAERFSHELPRGSASRSTPMSNRVLAVAAITLVGAAIVATSLLFRL